MSVTVFAPSVPSVRGSLNTVTNLYFALFTATIVAGVSLLWLGMAALTSLSDWETEELRRACNSSYGIPAMWRGLVRSDW